ncbi:MAG: ABC transporter ATP-binding protein [Eubacteriales bacterium]
MHEPMGPAGGNAAQKKPLPKHLREWPRFIMNGAKDLFRRLFYIYTLVWEASPFILVVMAFMAVFNGVSPLISAYIAKMFLDALAKAASGQLTDFWQLGGLLLLQIGYRFFVRIIGSINNTIDRLSSEIVVYSIRLRIMNKAKTIDLAKFDQPQFYSDLENANREVGGRPLQILSQSFSVVSTLISLVGFIAVLASIMPWAPVILIVISVPSAIISFKYRKKMFNYIRKRSRDRREKDYYSNLLVDKDLVKEIKLFDLGDMFIGRYKEVFGRYFNGMRTLIVQESAWGLVVAFVQSVATGGIFLVISKRVFDGFNTVGDYSLYSEALFAITNSVASLVNTGAGIYEGTLFIDNLMSFMDVEPTIVPSIDPPRSIDLNSRHSIEFRHVSFAYPGTQRDVLHDISFTIEQGETVVLVGLNGAGKTTLLKILTRLYDPTQGVVLFDGHDIREYDVKQLYSVFGIIFQDFGRYAFTVRENIAFGNMENLDDLEGIAEAAKKSSADEYIKGLPKGYDTPLTRVFDESGRELSVGQWQKIAVARAFFRNSPIMILDEPTASLDAIAEQKIFSQFGELSKTKDGMPKTTVFVSHRLSSATIADKIFVLDGGVLAEVGTHRELMAKNGIYAELFNTQARRYIENAEVPDEGEEKATGGEDKRGHDEPHGGPHGEPHGGGH